MLGPAPVPLDELNKVLGIFLFTVPGNLALNMFLVCAVWNTYSLGVVTLNGDHAEEHIYSEISRHCEQKDPQ